MAYCSNCGKKISDFAQECPHCHGKDVSSRVETETEVKVEYKTSIKSELLFNLIACLLIMPIAEMVKFVSINYRSPAYGSNAVMSLSVCNNAISPIICAMVALIIFSGVTIATNYMMRKNNMNKVVRIFFYIVGIIVYTSVLVLLSGRAQRIVGREDLYQMIDLIRNNLGVFYGLVYGSVVFALTQFISIKKVITTIFIAILPIIIYWIYSAVILSLSLRFDMMFSPIVAVIICIIFMGIGSLTMIFRGNR